MLFIPDSHVRLILLMREESEDGEGEGEEEVEVDGDGDGDGEGEEEDEDEGDGEEEEDEEEGEKDGEEEQEGGGWFSLVIPLDAIDSLCLTPRKYLLYLGWCILGFDTDDTLALGHAGEDGEFHRIDNNGDLDGGSTYTLMFDDPPPGKYSSVPHERAVLIHGRHGCSGHRGHQGTDGRTF